jgi:hypothetical protein
MKSISEYRFFLHFYSIPSGAVYKKTKKKRKNIDIATIFIFIPVRSGILGVFIDKK